MPWILIDHILEGILEREEVAPLESIFFPFAIYDDAATRALNSLNQRFLFDEIEAEVNLCFDQLVYKLSDAIYRQYKEHASRYERPSFRSSASNTTVVRCVSGAIESDCICLG